MSSWEQILKESSSDRRVETMEAVPGSHGPASTWYHNPNTGQEFPGLPVDGWSLMRYMMRGLRPGRAPKELREQFLASQRERPELNPEVLAQVEGIDATKAQPAAHSSTLEQLVIQLQQQVAELTSRLTGQPGAVQPVPVPVLQEPVQLKLL